MESNITIIQGCKNYDNKYQRILYEKYHVFALKIVFRYIYNYEEALEVTNDGFVKFFLRIEKFRCENEVDLDNILRGWIKKIMVNTSIDLLRKKMLLPEIGSIPEYVWGLKDNSTAADKMIIYKDLIKLIKKLPPSYRIVFNMHVIDGYTHFEIADSLGIPVGTSKSHLLRARALLQNYLKEKEDLILCRI
ncbi:MAG: RNA polymerase sigma factor [Bacteroidota bacterium]|nr:RNA polymerase sigma factor [Bacteroidota bacterium]